MGLFDIFRRKSKQKKEEAPESAASENAESQAAANESAAGQSTAAESEVSEGTASQSTAAESEAASAANDQKEAAAKIDEATAVAMQESAAAAEEQAAQSDAARQAEQAAIEKAQSEAAKQSAAAAEEHAAQVKSAQSQAASEAISDERSAEQADSQSDGTEAASAGSDESAVTATVKASVAAEETVEEPTKAAEPQSATDYDSAAAVQAEMDATVEPNNENNEAAVSASQVEESTTEKYDRGLKKSRTGFGAKLNHFLANFRHVDEDFFEDLEDLLIESDVGYDMAMKISDELREEVKLQNAKSKQDVSNVIIEKMVDLYEDAGKDENPDLSFAKEGPTVIMFVGVNGAGKTTTIGKMAKRFKDEGKRVLLAAGDTFRAGAVEQLDVWAKRDGVDIVMGPANGDPAAVVFDGVKKAKEENYDILLVDTAGRLQNKVNLMNELAKMKRIMAREIPDAPHEVLLVLDATTGQNALNQAKLFKESTDVSGIVLTKLDGTARGGIVLAIRNELHLPVKYVGLGEKVTDLQKFDASDFVYGLFKGLIVEK
ncbi:signal recognition particle-docking protein FtsY [Limosilactobacillus mucosae]|uniref:signal recognition particle-docking protein FtsY n=1 Tax=Limosilactobacillus mucosae TaxID=97478 RepID=UPI00088C4BDE|nr:signal recognition particle-docking protein FtsY [Limosilactobacillus mucosae]SDN32109.1 signal recognition particle-docking protein FtsY [Limosilactobacillus mucosae]SEK79735.1 signal recognition particle-docking protein FtsY [Limosilactobacillus mucosae]SFK13348.1 signal recognition particle-docking protein FtsY [Limosilactobacillus mucosae]